jgi:hypothetical protein
MRTEVSILTIKNFSRILNRITDKRIFGILLQAGTSKNSLPYLAFLISMEDFKTVILGGFYNNSCITLYNYTSTEHLLYRTLFFTHKYLLMF